MANIFLPTESKQFFVGRRPELAQLTAVLRDEKPKWIIQIPGPGGVGKTRLLERFREIAAQHPNALVMAELVDFYDTANQTGFGLLQDITRSLGENRFPSFAKERQHFVRLLTAAPEPGERQDAANRVLTAFIDDYKALLQEGFRPVLLFDTCEEMHAVEPWVLNTFLPKIEQAEAELQEDAATGDKPTLGEESIERHAQTIAVFAGRKRLAFPPDLAVHHLILELPPLSQEEMTEFFRQGGIDVNFVNDEQLAELYELTGGRPLYVALSFDWLQNEIGTIDELLALERPFGEKLVGWVLRLKSAESHAILYSAIAWRRMEPSLLAQLLNQNEEEAQQLIEALSRFSFIKYRAPSEEILGRFQLHDEMRVLIQQYVWPQEGKQTRHALLPQVINWYEARIGNSQLLTGEVLLQNDEVRALLAEWLFYQCQYNMETGFVHYERLFRKASHHLELSFCELLNEEIRRIAAEGNVLSTDQQDALRFREALVASRREQYDRATAIWQSLIRKSGVDDKHRATSLMLLVELQGYTGQPDTALQHAAQAEKLYQQLIADAADVEQRRLLETELGQLYNNWGFIHRVKSNLPAALEYYNKALASAHHPKNIARTLNNIGFIYSLQGDVVKARTYVGRSIHLRRQLKIPYELGLGYNTMGIIMRDSGRIDEAADLFRKAQLEFEAARSERGYALVALYRGHLNRVINDYEEAIEYLTDSLHIFEAKNDKDQLIIVLNELGCTYRQRGQPDDWEKAQHYLQQSLGLCEELNNTFRQVDNLEDISVLYYRMYRDAHNQHDEEKAQRYAQLAFKTAREAGELAERHGYTYLQAKNERVLGDLAHDDGTYNQAFARYFAACQLMARARFERGDSPGRLQRRYEQTVDRLQERLQTLDPIETEQQAQRLLEQYNLLTGDERELLEGLADFLQASIDVAGQTQRILP